MNKLADEILSELRYCKTDDEIHKVAGKYRADAALMKETDPDRYHHIVNAKAYYLKGLKNT